ncbi:hypothetical protein A5758_06270 [Mycobacterium sp. 852014-50255_SCH5639931]|nr:hypothetical protein A5758_06270 [Mycobacterium sp. 852014-50255_SCH5639931]
MFRRIIMQIFSMALVFSICWIELLYFELISVIYVVSMVELTKIPVKVQPPAPVSPELVNRDE